MLSFGATRRQGYSPDSLPRPDDGYFIFGKAPTIQAGEGRINKERMKIFIGPDALHDDEKMVRGIMGFIQGALSEKKQPAF